MINILVIGDPHFKEKGIKRYEKMKQEIINNVSSLYNEGRLDIVVILGDILHKHESSHQAPYDMATDMIIKISLVCPVYLLIGNHDYINNSQFLSDKHFFNPLKNIHNIFIVDYPLTINIKDKFFSMVPYVYHGRFHEALSKLNEKVEINTAIFCHQEIYGVKMGAIYSEVGDKWPDEFPLLICGHIHEFSMLKENVIYVGTPIQHAFGDGHDKGIYLFSFNDESGKMDMKKITINVPLKKIFKLSFDDVYNFKIPPNVEAKIIVRCTPEEYSRLVKNKVLDRFEGATVEHENTEILKSVPSSDDCRPFREILYDKIKDDQELVNIYKELYN